MFKTFTGIYNWHNGNGIEKEKKCKEMVITHCHKSTVVQNVGLLGVL